MFESYIFLISTPNYIYTPNFNKMASEIENNGFNGQ